VKQEKEEERRRWRIVGISKISKITFMLIILFDQSLNHLGNVWSIL